MNRLDSLDPQSPQTHQSDKGAAHPASGNGIRKNGRESNGPTEPMRYLEIADTGRIRYLRGLIAYLLFFCAVAAALVWVFLYFTPHLALAIGLVGFMIAYMAGMGWLASRNIEQREREDH